jgi:uroporphyrin-III C-methyltransferase
MRPLAKVALVGAGPGDADLITLRGMRYLQEADVILADALIDPAFRSMVGEVTWIDVGKRGFKASCAQTDIDRQLVLFAQCGMRVVRLKGGDPSLFARGEEEIAALKTANIEFEIVPGVSAALAAAAFTQRPLTRRGAGRSVTIQTAVYKENEQAMVASQFAGKSNLHADSLVLYMVGQQIAVVADHLTAQGWPGDTPVLLVSNAGTVNQTSSDGVLHNLAQLAPAHSGMPTVLTIGVAAKVVTSNPATDSSAEKTELLAGQLQH